MSRKNRAWIARIQKGDVLKWPNGTLRVVRAVSHSQIPIGCGGNSRPTIRTSVRLAIRHCSWTHRPTTTYTGNDLVQMDVRPTRARVTLRKKIDRLIELDYVNSGKEREIFCCDVIGRVS